MIIAISVSAREMREGQKSPYYRALLESGAKPEELQMVTAPEEGLHFECMHGLLLAGGEDVDPALYGESPKHESVKVNRSRDAFELPLLAQALHRHVPVLGICRGAQLVNVKYGGDLYQDLEKDWAPISADSPVIHHKQPGSRSDATHAVVVTDPESRLAQTLPRTCPVNSMHHQGIKRTGHGLRATAHAEDGLVEAIEAADRGAYLVAVQWHPEELVHLPEHKKLFQQFLAECRRPM
jgi:putative glutamine amidotransferase